ncbi:hypothetical protein C8R43DRAFT_1135083 [Mycena crocata]|nr:hypothetical protein C8R43DRAFT_1135083 [Mycena crocata]
MEDPKFPPSCGTESNEDASSNDSAQDYYRLCDALILDPHLHTILALASVFCQTPSPLQLAHVLNISWETVQKSLAPTAVCVLLEPPNRPPQYYSDVRLSVRLRQLLSDPATYPATYVDPQRWHALLAVWCLNRSSIKYDARDIFYASDFWAEHVRSARPSQDLWDALRRSPIPCRLSSHAMLPRVITWLETVESDDARELISIYRTAYRQRASALVSGLRVK